MNESKVFYDPRQGRHDALRHRRPARSRPTSASRRTGACARSTGRRQIVDAGEHRGPRRSAHLWRAAHDRRAPVSWPRRCGTRRCRRARKSTCRTGRARLRPRTIATGQPAEIVLMRPLGDPSRPASRYVDPDHPEVLKERSCAALPWPCFSCCRWRSSRRPLDWLGAGSATGPAQASRDGAVTVLRPARVFDGDTMHEGWAVRVRGDRIEAAGPAARRRRGRGHGRRPAGDDADARAGRRALARPAASLQRDHVERPGAAREPRRCASRARRITCAPR